MNFAIRFSLLVMAQIAIQLTHGRQTTKFFRNDYTYLEDTQNFYKIHTIHRTWKDAKNRCAMEGATLFYPVDRSEADAVLKLWNQTQPFAWVFIGVSDLIAKGVFETYDGVPIADIYNNWGPGEPNDRDGIEDCVILRKDGTLNDDRCHYKYPFICKKTYFSLEWNQLCELPDKEYLFNDQLGKCYKFHLKPMNWTDAYSICDAEQSYLAVINTQAEADHLVALTRQAPKDNIQGNYLRGAVFLGFHNMDDDGWKTIKGTSLEDSGYSRWSYNQPDGGEWERCGSMFYNGELNDLGCAQVCFFICEHDISKFRSSLEERSVLNG